MEPMDLINFANDWTGLGAAVQEQVTRVIEGDANDDNTNPAAIRLASRELGRHSTELKVELNEWLETYGNGD
jgi:hypothetical protein